MSGGRERDALVLVDGPKLYLLDRTKAATIKTVYSEQDGAMAAASTVCGRSTEVVLPPHLVCRNRCAGCVNGGRRFYDPYLKDASGLHFSESAAQSAASVEEHARYLPSPRLRGKGWGEGQIRLHHTRFPQRCDLTLVIAGFGQNLGVVLADSGRRAVDAATAMRQPEPGADQGQLAIR